MAEIFRLITPISYWVLILLWLFILIFYVRKMWGKKSEKLFSTLIVILAIDAFRTLFESIYFGTWYTSLAGIIPRHIATFLMRPEWVIIPKFINIVAAVIVIFLLLKRWLPEEEKRKTDSLEALLASEQKFKAFTSQSVDGISVADNDGNYTYVNQAFCDMIGYSEQELLAMTVFDVTSDSQDKATFSKSKGSGEGTPIHVVLKRKNGNDFLAEVVGKNIEFGNVQYVLGVIRDITDREKAVEEKLYLDRQMQHAQKLESLGVLAGGIAHDFNNLLTAIMGNASMAQDELSPSSPVRSRIDEIEKATKRAADLSRQMLAYSGRGHFIIQSINPRELIEEITHLLEVSVSKKVQLKFNFSDNTPDFRGDVSQISQIVMNLITNASKSIGDERGMISLSTGVMDCSRTYLDSVNLTLRAGLREPLAAGRYTFFEVSDTGCGMDAETIDRIFDPFYTTKFTGRGLGMSAVLGIIHGHHGALNVYSEVGRGTTFRVLFPVEEEAPFAHSNPDESGDEGRRWKGKGTILVVDDEESIRFIVKEMLINLGFDVLLAVDGRDGVNVFTEHQSEIACTLLDLTMPNMDGQEAFGEIRKVDPEALVLLCSGYGEQEATLSFSGRGLSGFISKPFEINKLRAELKDVLDG
jgi:PAS domain S-box-containing protein